MSSERLKVGLIGVGMVGEPIKRWFEEHQGYVMGEDLFCYDSDPAKNFHDDINKADVVFIAVPTPVGIDGQCDLSIVESAVKMINDSKIVVIKSTITPGTVERFQKKYSTKKFIFNPEFLTESQYWLDYIKPDRQILGHTVQSANGIREILALLPRAPFERPWSSDYTKKDMSASEAELTKYASNVFGYIKVIYGNMLADVCHALDLDLSSQKIQAPVQYQNIREALSADPRIGPAWLNVEHGNYCGAGGYCFPKDMSAFIHFVDTMREKMAAHKQADPHLSTSLKKATAVLKSIADYNKHLLEWQGLTVKDVSLHDKQIVVDKRKPIRVHQSESSKTTKKKTAKK